MNDEAVDSSAQTQRGVAVGDTLGRYLLLEEIGEGGMATVFRARDTQLRREVAVKVLFPHLAKRTEVVHRFAREARAAARLEHANILRVLDVSVAASTTTQSQPPYIVMDLIRGQSLQAFVAEHGPLIAEFAAAIVAQLADALALAHGAGIVHRDVKPANVMVTSSGQLLLTDFGVAQVAADESLVTKTGALLGTPAYMSPEQATGDAVGPASDVYSLGATLYQLVTGGVPFAGNTAKVLSQIAAGTVVAADRKQPRAGSEVARIIADCMAMDATRRPSAATLAQDLQRFAQTAQLGDAAAMVQRQLRDPVQTQSQQMHIVKHLIARAEHNFAAKQSALAIALVERASQIDPNDRDAATLIATWQRRSSVHSKAKVLLAAALVAAIGGGGWLVLRSKRQSSSVAVFDADHGADKQTLGSGAGPALLPPINAVDAVEVAIQAPTQVSDAAIGDTADILSEKRTDAARRVEPKAAVAKAVDARPRAPAFAGSLSDETLSLPPPLEPVDAAPVPAVVVAPNVAPAEGTMAVTMDTWCDVSIDGQSRGRWKKGMTLSVPAGVHKVQCGQGPGMPMWNGTAIVVAGQTVQVQGNLLGLVTVTAGLGAPLSIVQRKINDGSDIQLAPGRHRISVWRDGVIVLQQWVTVAAAAPGQQARCTLRMVAGAIECESSR